MNLMTLLKPKGEIEYLHKEDTLRQGLERMRIYGYTALPVIDEDGCYAGSVNEGDFLWYMLTYHKCDMQELESFQIKEIIRKDWMPPVYVYATIDEMIERASNQNYVPVVDDRNVFIGIITRRDIINAFRRQQDQQTDQNEGIKIQTLNQSIGFRWQPALKHIMRIMMVLSFVMEQTRWHLRRQHFLI